MTDNSKFESRTGKLTCTTAELFNFITDIRNFEQFIPDGSIRNWQATSDECSFQVPAIGTASARISERTPFALVIYTGDALQKNDFKLEVHISENNRIFSDVRLTLIAELNPVLRMMAAAPIERLLETLVSEMEKFEKWNGISK
jgi:hypothetical protein